MVGVNIRRGLSEIHLGAGRVKIIVALSVLQALNCKGIKGLCFRTREAVVVRQQ